MSQGHAHRLEVEATALEAGLPTSAGGGHQGELLEAVDQPLRQAGGRVQDVGGHAHHGVPDCLGPGVLVCKAGQERRWLTVGVVRKVQHACDCHEHSHDC